MTRVMVGRRSPVEVAVGAGAVPLFCSFGPGFEPAVGATRVGLFETASDVDNCDKRVGGMIDSLDADLESWLTKRYGSSIFIGPTILVWSSTTKPKPDTFSEDQDFFNAWKTFRGEWRAWQDEWEATKRTGSVLSAADYRECEKYDLEAKDWHDRFEAKGIKPTAPKTTTPGTIPGITPDTPPSGSTSSTLDDIANVVKWAVIGVTVIGAVMLLSSLSHATSAT